MVYSPPNGVDLWPPKIIIVGHWMHSMCSFDLDIKDSEGAARLNQMGSYSNDKHIVTT